MNGRIGLDQGFEPGILFRGPFVVAVSGHGNSPCSLARQHNSNIPRCQNCQGAEKTDGNSQEQAAVLCHLPFAFGRSTRSSRNSSGPLVSRVGALLGRGDFLLQIIIFDRLSVVFEKLQIRKIRARPKRPRLPSTNADIPSPEIGRRGCKDGHVRQRTRRLNHRRVRWRAVSNSRSWPRRYRPGSAFYHESIFKCDQRRQQT
jgi:hypothetical protein